MAVSIDPKAGAKAARAIIAAHEAGMHDRKSSDACRLCKKEAFIGAGRLRTITNAARKPQEQEAQTVAKERTECITCGGSFDGTPSGQKKHEATARHREGGYRESLAAVTDAPLAQPGTEVIAAQAPIPPVVTDGLVGALSALIDVKEQELARRQIDWKWREGHQADKAEAYRLDKVVPLLVEIQTLRRVRKALS